MFRRRSDESARSRCVRMRGPGCLRQRVVDKRCNPVGCKGQRQRDFGALGERTARALGHRAGRPASGRHQAHPRRADRPAIARRPGHGQEARSRPRGAGRDRSGAASDSCPSVFAESARRQSASLRRRRQEVLRRQCAAVRRPQGLSLARSVGARAGQPDGGVQSHGRQTQGHCRSRALVARQQDRIHGQRSGAPRRTSADEFTQAPESDEGWRDRHF